MGNLSPVWREVIKIIKKSPVPEDPIHAKNTLYWLLRIEPKADKILRLAAFSHDIERAIPEKKVKRKDFSDYESFKKAHAENSASIMAQIMKKYGICDKEIKEIRHLILHHEEGGDPRSDLIKDADALSFFDVNLLYYMKRNPMDEVIFRCRWGYRRISPERRVFLKEIMRKNKKLSSIIRKVIKDE